MSLAVPFLEDVVGPGLPRAAAPSLAAWATRPASRSAPATPTANKGDRADDGEDQEDEEQRAQEAEEPEAEAKRMAVVGHDRGGRSRRHHLGAGVKPHLVRDAAHQDRADDHHQQREKTESTPSVHR